MSLIDVVDIANTRERSVAAILQLVLAAIVGFGVVTGAWSTVVTAGIALGVTLLPALLEREYDYTLSSGLLLWLTLAVTVHTAGTLGLYEQFQWFDNIAHTISAMVIAGLGYSSFRALELHSNELDVPPAFRAVFILVFVLATGVFWEVLEFALGNLITVYGVQDIVTDMMFNTLGAIIVAVWGTGYLGGLIGFFLHRFQPSDPGN